MRDFTVEQHSTWNGSVLNCHRVDTASTQLPPREDAKYALHCICLVSKFFFIPANASLPSLRSCSPLKSVLNKIGDSYQMYCNTYKSHAMATHHGGSGQPLDRDPNPLGQNTDIPSNYLEDMDNFKNMEHENHSTLKALTRNLDDLQHRVENTEGQPMEAIHHLECELHRLSLTFQTSAPPEPLDEVLKQYTETLCTVQRQTTFTNTLF